MRDVLHVGSAKLALRRDGTAALYRNLNISGKRRDCVGVAFALCCAGVNVFGPSFHDGLSWQAIWSADSRWAFRDCLCVDV